MMASEFSGLNLACSPASVIPQGPGFEDVNYQSCAIAGSVSGSLAVYGDDYIAAQFGYYYSHIWRNFGILLLFSVVFILFAAVFSEVLEWNLGGGGALHYKKMSSTLKRQPQSGIDEEEKQVDIDSRRPSYSNFTLDNNSGVQVNLETSTSTFTWEDLTYTIPYDGSSKVLLNKVSGYCAPGKMTALVGSSGAGKTTRKSFLHSHHLEWGHV
jgi:ATP-binding cassette, subfamily G (WHITE), member 2, SNQ2